MIKASYYNYSFVSKLRSYLKDVTIFTLIVTNYKNTMCNKSLIYKKEESDTLVFGQ
jgi:hypothetical protein